MYIGEYVKKEAMKFSLCLVYRSNLYVSVQKGITDGMSIWDGNYK